MMEEQLILARWALYVDLGLLFGFPLFSLYSGRGGAAAMALRLRLPVVFLALAAMFISAWSLLIMTATMIGATLLTLDREALGMILTETNVGWAFAVRLAALLMVIAFAIGSKLRGTASVAGVSLFAGIALASLAWNGHGVATEGSLGYVHLASDIVHLFAASAWIGALAAFLWTTAASYRDIPGAIEGAQGALAGFATAGTVMVGLIVLTGLINSWILVGPEHILSLGATSYGRLLMIKLALFAVMLALATANRFRLTPGLKTGIVRGDSEGAIARLRRSLWLEAGAGIAILALVAWLGTLPPPAAG